MRFLLGLLFFSCFGLCTPHGALAFSRVQMPVAYYAKQADLVIVVDVTRPQAPDYKWLLKVREVLQGKAPVGEVVSIRQNRAIASFLLPYKDGTAAVFLKKGADGGWEVLESRSQPDDIAALRILVPLFQLPAEREQITGLQKAVRQTPALALLGSELESALQEMHQPDNFDLIENSLALLNAKQRENMMRALGRMNDMRAVPLLLRALQAPEKSIAGNAAQTLVYYYPGAPGVTEAMRAILGDEAAGEFMKRTAQTYLAKRDASVAVVVEQQRTPYLEARQLFQSARKAEGALAHLHLLETQKPDGYFSHWTAEEILPFLNDEGKARLRRVVIKQALKKPNYLEAESLLKLLRRMPHPEAIPALINLLNEPQPSASSFVWRKAAMFSAFLLHELGPQARKQATARLLENWRQLIAETKRDEEPTLFLLQMAWLADDEIWQQVPDLIAPGRRAEWQALTLVRAAVTGAVTQENEGRNLVALLKNLPQDFSAQARQWIIYRLGDLHEENAVAPLLEQLPQSIYMSPPAHKEALMEIGGAEVEEGALKLLRHGNSEVRRQAMGILRDLRGDKMRPLLRQILSAPDEENFGHKNDAASLMGALGTPEDLPLLLPLADFWKTDRALQNWAVSSIDSIRDRFNYDVNGPIQKVG
ncbi:MAG TPA: HEAT repeat domain-containing protein [Abditibacteriaceae bacterium]|jgi:HEAT repeat protein